MITEQLKPLFEKAVRENNFVNDNQRELLSKIVKDGSRVLVMGGFGEIAEFLALEKNCQVTLVEESGIVASVRRKLVPNSTVRFLNINPAKFIVSGKLYDLAIIFNKALEDHASKMSLQTLLINGNNAELIVEVDIYDVNNAKINEPQSKITPDQENDKQE